MDDFHVAYSSKRCGGMGLKTWGGNPWSVAQGVELKSPIEARGHDGLEGLGPVTASTEPEADAGPTKSE